MSLHFQKAFSTRNDENPAVQEGSKHLLHSFKEKKELWAYLNSANTKTTKAINSTSLGQSKIASTSKYNNEESIENKGKGDRFSSAALDKYSNKLKASLVDPFDISLIPTDLHKKSEENYKFKSSGLKLCSSTPDLRKLSEENSNSSKRLNPSRRLNNSPLPSQIVQLAQLIPNKNKRSNLAERLNSMNLTTRSQVEIGEEISRRESNLEKQYNNSLLITEEVFRADLSTQSEVRLHYGCRIALELFDRRFLMVNSTNGHLCAQPLDQLSSRNKHAIDKVLLTIVDINDLHNASPIKYGDSIWLQITSGTGEGSWEQGSVVGAKIRGAPILKTISRKKGAEISHNNEQKNGTIGTAVPIQAYLPKVREEELNEAQFTKMKKKNKHPSYVGRWKIKYALAIAKESSPPIEVYNLDEIYLEQDWFYLGIDAENNAILRQVSSEQETKAEGEYLIERKGSWKIHIADINNGGNGLTLVQQQMEKLLYKAKNQLKQSKKLRNGELKQYDKDLVSGSSFSKQIRIHRERANNLYNDLYLRPEVNKLINLKDYFRQKFINTPSLSSNEPSLPIKQTLGYRSNTPIKKNEREHSYSVSIENLIEESVSDHKTCGLCSSFSTQFNLCLEGHQLENRIKETKSAARLLPSYKDNETESNLSSPLKGLMEVLHQQDNAMLRSILGAKTMI